MFEPEWIDAGAGGRVLFKPITGPQFMRLVATEITTPTGNMLLDPDVAYAVFASNALEWENLPLLDGTVIASSKSIEHYEYRRVVDRITPGRVSMVVREALSRAVMTEEQRKNSSRPQTSGSTPSTSTAAAAPATTDDSSAESDIS